MPSKTLNQSPETLVLGAGPAGLACAMELSREGRVCTVVERDELIGGLAKTLTVREGDVPAEIAAVFDIESLGLGSCEKILRLHFATIP